MLKLDDLDIILKRMDKKEKFNDFIYYAFNYKIEGEVIQYYVQHIEDDIILYICEKGRPYVLYSLEFTNGICDVYMDKSFYKNTFINTVYINKCLDLYDVVDDNVISYCKAMNAENIDNQKKLLLRHIPKELVKIMYDEE